MKVEIQELLDNFVIDEDLLKGLLITNVKDSMERNSCAFGYMEIFKATIIKQIEQTKLDYKLWLSDKKKELDRKIYNSEMAKEDAVISKYRAEYLEYNKKIIDLTYQQNLLLGITKAYEMRANLLITLKDKKEKEEYKVVLDWNKKIEQTKI